jgi:ASC-1-like (ASCH) protein
MVRDIRKYHTFREALAKENPKHIAPDHHGSVLDLLQKIYPPDRERLGVVVLEIEPAA